MAEMGIICRSNIHIYEFKTLLKHTFSLKLFGVKTLFLYVLQASVSN